MTKTILLLSGTSEGRILARMLCEAGFRVRATVTRAETVGNFFADRKLQIADCRLQIANSANLQSAICNLQSPVTVEARGFTEDSLTEFLRQGQADAVLDATHPFAVRITRLSHAVCGRLGIPYVRYERPDWQPPEGTLFVDSFIQAAEMLLSLGKPAMLTIGCKQLKHFVHLQDQLDMHARILPSDPSIQQAVAAGFRGDRLICQRPPISREMNRASFQEHGICVLVSKASGREGGVVEKVEAAQDLGIKVVMIRRPVLGDIAVVSSVAEAVQVCSRSVMLPSPEASG